MSLSSLFAPLRTRLILLMLLVIMPACGLVLYGNFEQRRTEKARVQEGATAVAHLAAATEQNFIEHSRQLLLTLTQFPFLTLTTNNISSQWNLSNLRKLSPDYSDFGLIETNGDLFCSADFTNSTKNFSDSDYFKAVLRTGRFAAGSFMPAEAAREASLTVALPVRDDQGRLQRILYASLKLSRFSEAITNIALPSGATTTIVDRHGVILARHPQPEAWVGRPLGNPSLLRAVLDGKHSIVEMPGLNGVPSLHALDLVGDGQSPSLFVIVATPLAVSFARANETLLRNLVILGLVALVIWSLARFYAQCFFVRPVSVLTAAADRMAQGNLGARTGRIKGAAELVQLGLVLDDMADRLQRRQWEVQLAHQSLRDSEKRYRDLFECNPRPMWVYDTQTLKFLAVNEVAVAHYGFSREQFLAMTVPDIYAEDSAPVVLADAGLGSPDPERCECQHRRSDGTVIDVEITSHEFQFDGHSAHLVLATDVTEHKKLEVQFLRAQRMQLIGALAGGIAHDLNNALAPVSMGIELLREGISGDDLTSLLATMQGSAKRGVEMVRQILTFARGVSGEIAPLDLGQLVCEMDKFAQQTFPRSIAIHTRVASGLTRVVGNATQLHQVLLNLCVNARDAMPGGGSLRLEAGNVLLDNRTVTWQPKPVSGRHVLLTISDTGHGIPPEVMDRIFEPFFTTKQPGKGTGLGLSTVQGIVKSHGGFLEISSSAGVGTTFNVYLPAADSSLPDPADPVRNQNGSPESKLLTA